MSVRSRRLSSTASDVLGSQVLADYASRSTNSHARLSLDLSTNSIRLGYVRNGSFHVDSNGFSSGPTDSNFTTGSFRDLLSLPADSSSRRRGNFTRDQLLEFQLYGNDLNYGMDQNNLLGGRDDASPHESVNADMTLIQSNLVAGYTLIAPLTTERLSSLLYHAEEKTSGSKVIIRLLPNFVDSVHVARFLNEWYVTLGSNPPVRHRLWGNTSITNPYIPAEALSLSDPKQRVLLSSPVTLPPNVPGILYPVRTFNVLVSMENANQKRLGIIYPDNGFTTIRDYYRERTRRNGGIEEEETGSVNTGSIKSILTDLSIEAASHEKQFPKSKVNDGVFDDLANKVMQTPKSRATVIDILSDIIAVLATINISHELGIVHNGITSHHILRSSESKASAGSVVLTGWDFSFVIAGEDSSQGFRNLNLSDIPELLPYLSPENMGETLCLVDYRSDYYSLGVVMYDLVLGCLPFQSDNPARLRRMHLSQNPISPYKLGPKFVSEKLSGIIMKCMEKNPDNRYQEGHLLINHLQEVIREYTGSGILNRLVSQEFVDEAATEPVRLPLKFLKVPYFHTSMTKIKNFPLRESVLKKFKSHKDGIHSIIIKGNAGIGKSTLLDEVKGAAVSRYDFVLHWKFNCSDLNVTKYSTSMAGVHSIIKQIMASSKENIAEWRHLITSELEMDMSVMFHAIPELKQFLGPRYGLLRARKEPTEAISSSLEGFSLTGSSSRQPSPDTPRVKDDSGFDELALNVELRYKYIIKKFFSIVALRGLTLILDDVQWCPDAEFDFLKELLEFCHHETANPLVNLVSSYNTDSAVSQYSDQILDLNAYLTAFPTAESLIYEMGQLTEQQFQEFADFPALVSTKKLGIWHHVFALTGGNRLCFHYLMKYIRLRFGSSASLDEAINHLDFEGSGRMPLRIMDVIGAYLDITITAETKRMLKFAILINSGGLIQLSDLLVVSGMSLIEAHKLIHECLEFGLLIPSGIYYKVPFHLIASESFPFDTSDAIIWEIATKTRFYFDHDSIQLYLLRDMQRNNEWEHYHRLCGLRFFKKSSMEHEVNVTRYLEMATHLLIAKDAALEVDFDKYHEALVAGGKYALTTSNLNLALKFFKCAEGFVDAVDRQRRMELKLSLCSTNYLLKNYTKCVDIIREVEVEYPGNSANLIYIEIKCLFHKRDFKNGVKRTLRALDSLNVDITRDPQKSELLFMKNLEKIPLTTPNIRSLKDLPYSRNSKFNLIADLIQDIIGPTYILGLTGLRISLLTQLILLMQQYGKSASTAIGLIHLANYFMQPHSQMNPQRGIDYCDVALELIGNVAGVSTSSNEAINEAYMVFMAPFKFNTNGLVKYADKFSLGTSALIQTCDSSFSLFVLASGFLLSFMNGNATALQFKESHKRRIQFEHEQEALLFQNSMALWLEEISFESYKALFPSIDKGRPDLEFVYQANAVLWCTSLGMFTEGAKIVQERAYHVLRKLPVSILHMEFYFYSAICLCFDSQTNMSGLALAKKISGMISSWSKVCYANFGSKHLLLEACIKCKSTKHSSLKLLDMFEEAIESASTNGKWFETALGHHLCASWLLRTGESSRRALQSARSAMSLYATMNADRQVEMIKTEFADFFEEFNWAGVPTVANAAPKQAIDLGGVKSLNHKLQEIFQDNTAGNSSVQIESSQNRRSTSQSPLQPSALADLTKAIKLCLTISESSNLDSIVTSLLESTLLLSGVDYGAVIMTNTAGEPCLRCVGTLHHLYRMEGEAISARTDLVPYMMVIECLLSGEVINKDDDPVRFQNQFGSDSYYTHNECSSAICIPIKSSHTFGAIYLERQAHHREILHPQEVLNHTRVGLLDLLCSQAAVSFSKALVYEQMELAKKAAEDATAEKASFLANMSHEIRTPFNSLFACSVFLLDTDLSFTQREYVQTIRDSALVTLSIVDGILAFSKIEHGSFTLELAPFDVHEIIESAVQVSVEQAEASGLELAFVNNVPEIENVIGDATRVRQIIINLVGNAVKFTLKGHVLVTLDAVEIKDSRYEFRISVEDTGIGIPELSKSKIFGAFSQVDGSSRRVYGGSGLGLTISKKLAEVMGGKITFESQEMKGSVFVFSCPLDVQFVSRKLPLPVLNVALVTTSCFKASATSALVEYYGLTCKQFRSTEELNSSAQKFDLIFVDEHGEGRLDNKKVLHPDGRVYLVVAFGLSHSDNFVQKLEMDAVVFTPIKRAQLFEILRADKKNSHVKEITTTPHGKSKLLADYPLSILIAEDNSINLRVALQHLKKLGYQADHAKDGLEALARCEEKLQKNSKYDVIFMDIQMPRMDGITATAELRDSFVKRGFQDYIPFVVALTANVAGEDRQKCLESGMIDFVTKPILPEELQRVLIKVGEGNRTGLI